VGFDLHREMAESRYRIAGRYVAAPRYGNSARRCCLPANIFLHLSFDRWMEDHFRNMHVERYADDVVVHCRSRQQLEMIKKRIERRLEQCKLRLNPDKTRIVYCKDSKLTEDLYCHSFDFLGYTFRPRSAQLQRRVLCQLQPGN
jgi:Reverse transcriptase (RNA-dependent DNA polymerase)